MKLQNRRRISWTHFKNHENLSVSDFMTQDELEWKNDSQGPRLKFDIDSVELIKFFDNNFHPKFERKWARKVVTEITLEMDFF